MDMAGEGFGGLIDAIRHDTVPAEMGERRAISDRAGGQYTYAALVTRAAAVCERLRAHRESGLLLVQADQSVGSAVALLGGLAAGYQVMLQPAALDHAIRSRLIDLFRPEASFYRDDLALIQNSGEPVHAGAALLLSTSGTTGSARFARLPLAALAANARQIAAVLGIRRDDVALAHLPVHYSYGLSVLTSHLEVGAAVHLTDASFTDVSLWQDAAKVGATHLPGVPFHYMFLARGAMRSLVPPSITSFTQAGGALALPIRKRIHEAADARRGRFYIMYGQTEAGPRMTTLDHADFPAHPESVGRVLPGGRLRILDQHGQDVAPGQEGEIVYDGPNLMAGYVEDRAALAVPDTPVEAVWTGDRGVLGADGFLTLRGRNSSCAKIGGLRLNLDEMAAQLTPFCDVALLPGDERILVFHADADDTELRRHVANLAARLKLPVGSFALLALSAIPRHESGKIDYQRLRELAA